MIRTSSFPIWCGTSITFCYKNATNSGNALTINKMWVIESRSNGDGADQAAEQGQARPGRTRIRHQCPRPPHPRNEDDGWQSFGWRIMERVPVRVGETPPGPRLLSGEPASNDERPDQFDSCKLVTDGQLNR